MNPNTARRMALDLRVYEAIYDSPGTATDIAAWFGDVHRETIRRSINRLVANGEIHRVGKRETVGRPEIIYAVTRQKRAA